MQGSPDRRSEHLGVGSMEGWKRTGTRPLREVGRVNGHFGRMRLRPLSPVRFNLLEGGRGERLGRWRPLDGGGFAEVGWVESAVFTPLPIQNFFCNFDGGAEAHGLLLLS